MNDHKDFDSNCGCNGCRACRIVERMREPKKDYSVFLTGMFFELRDSINEQRKNGYKLHTMFPPTDSFNEWSAVMVLE